jgi:hypothetical protein
VDCRVQIWTFAEGTLPKARWSRRRRWRDEKRGDVTSRVALLAARRLRVRARTCLHSPAARTLRLTTSCWATLVILCNGLYGYSLLCFLRVTLIRSGATVSPASVVTACLRLAHLITRRGLVLLARLSFISCQINPMPTVGWTIKCVVVGDVGSERCASLRTSGLSAYLHCADKPPIVVQHKNFPSESCVPMVRHGSCRSPALTGGPTGAQ